LEDADSECVLVFRILMCTSVHIFEYIMH
jgi:hypothetical protein